MVFAFYVEIQDGHQKWRKNDFWQKMTEDSVDILWIKIFVEMALSCTISEMNEVFFLFYTESQDDPPKMSGNNFCQKV